jgi:hypothetical protein
MLLADVCVEEDIPRPYCHGPIACNQLTQAATGRKAVRQLSLSQSPSLLCDAQHSMAQGRQSAILEKVGGAVWTVRSAPPGAHLPVALFAL